MAALAAVQTIGAKTFLRPCVHEDGTAAACAGAGTWLLALLGGVLTALTPGTLQPTEGSVFLEVDAGDHGSAAPEAEKEEPRADWASKNAQTKKPETQTAAGDRAGEDLYSLPDAELSRLRNRHIALIPQGRSAIDTLTVKENILLPAYMYNSASDGAEEEALRWMETLGIGALADSSPGELSGGELRRMSIARALCAHPGILLADEPTGDLDDENTALVLRVLREAAEAGAAVMIVSHENETLKYADRAWRMEAGALAPIGA